MKWIKLSKNGVWADKPDDGDASGVNATIMQWHHAKGFTFSCFAMGVHIRGPARTLKEAKANCEAHAERYGRKA